jgi:hypothetical protein
LLLGEKDLDKVFGFAGKLFSQMSLTAGLTTRRPLAHLLHLVLSEHGKAKFQVIKCNQGCRMN